MASIMWQPRNIIARSATAFVAVPAIIFILFQPVIFLQLLILALAIGIFREWSRLTMNKTFHMLNGVNLIALTCGFSPYWPAVALVTIFINACYFFIIKDKNRFLTVGGYFYLTASLGILMYVFPHIGGKHFMILVIAMVWLVDTGSFLVGKSIGGPKLWPTVSPNKTWSGFVGGILIGAIGAFLLVKFFHLENLPFLWIFIILSLPLAQAGDLLESWCKRSFHVKDSGHFFPGHGGLLDRLDSLFLVSYGVGLYQLLMVMVGK